MTNIDDKENVLKKYYLSKKKDENDILKHKNQIISEIKKYNKHELIKEPKKLSLWERVKIALGI